MERTNKRRWAVLPAVAAVVASLGLSSAPAHAEPVSGPVSAQPLVIHPDVFAHHDASNKAKQTRSAVVVDQLTTGNKRIWAQPDGSFTEELSTGHERFKRDGKWLEIDLNLAKRPDGTVAPMAYPADLVLSGAATAGENDLTAVTVNGEKSGMRWTGPLPEPVLDGTKATYVDAYPGIDIVVEILAGGYEQSFVVKNRAALAHVKAAQAALKMHGQGLGTDGNGGLKITDKASQVVSGFPKPLMWDAVTDPASGDHKNTKSIGLAASGRDFILSADMKWLNASERKFPITIDPYHALNMGPDGNSDHDTYVNESSPGTTYGTSTEIHVGIPAGYYGQRIGYVNFRAGDVSPGAKIHWASLKMYVIWATGGNCEDDGFQTYGYRPANAYNSTTWNNRPGVDTWGGEENGSGDYGCAGYWQPFDATSLFSAAINQGWGQFTVQVHKGNNGAGMKKYRSRDSGTAPHVMINYTYPPSVTESRTSSTGSCFGSSSGAPVLFTTTPALSAKVTADWRMLQSPDNGSSYALFEWFTTNGTKVGDSAVSGISSGSTVGVTIPAGQLHDNTTYYWRVSAQTQGSEGMWSDATTGPSCYFTVDTWADKVSGCSGTATSQTDFNGDSKVDTAIADPLKTVGTQWQAGAVNIVDGNTGAVTILDQSLSEVPDTAEGNDRFGSAIAVFDLNADGCADLAIGTPGEDLTATDSGRVDVLYGTPTGLGKGPAAEQFIQGTGQTPRSQIAQNLFGYALAAGSTAAGEAFLLIGAPGDDVNGNNDAGTATYIRGEQRTALTEANPERNDKFGMAVAASPHHVAISAPGEAMGPDTDFAGLVCVHGHSLARIGCIDQGNSGVSDDPEAQDLFGKSIAMTTYRAPGQPNGTDSILAVGVPGEDLGNTADTGMVHQFRLTGTGISELAAVSQDTNGIGGSNETGDMFGEKVFIVNLSPGAEASPTTLRVAVGIPGEDLGSTSDAGKVSVFAGGTNSITVDVSVERAAGSLPGSTVAREVIGMGLGGNASYLLVPASYSSSRALYAIKWSDLVAGSSTVSQTTAAPSGSAAFGSRIG